MDIMDKIKLLLVEDNEDYAFIIKNSMEQMGCYDIQVAYDGKEGLEMYKSFAPDFIVADIEMPVMDGKTMIRIIREHDVQTPVIFLTSHRDEFAQGMMIGADAFLHKPVSIEGLDAQIHATLKRASNKPISSGIDECTFGKLKFSPSNKYLSINGKRIDLTKIESTILWILVKSKGLLVTRKDILNSLDVFSQFASSRSLDVHISKIRKILSIDPSIKIITRRGNGYTLTDTSL